MIPDFRTLQLLVLVGELGSVAKAANTLEIPQPNASRMLSRMERQLGTTLLIRTPLGSKLTLEGEAVARWSQPVLDQIELWNAGVDSLRDDIQSQLSVAASQTIAEYLAPGWLAGFQISHPATSVTLRVANSAQVMSLVREGLVSLGFIETPDAPPDLQSTIIQRDRLILVVAPGHPWATRTSPVSLARLAATPLVCREEGSGTRLTYLKALAGYSLAPPACEVWSNAAVVGTTVGGLAPAMLSLLVVAPLIQAGRLVQVKTAEPQRFIRPLRAVWRRTEQMIGLSADFVRQASNPAGA